MHPRTLLHRQAGFSLAELMVASAIGLIILAGMATLFVNNSRAQAEIEKANRQIENGRYAMQLLSTDLTNAGFYGEFDPTPLPDPDPLPDLCALRVSDLRATLPMAVQGADAPEAAALTCLPDRKPDTDVLVVRRTQTCVAGTGNCAPTADGGVFLQASLCYNNQELGSSDPANHFDLATDVSLLTRHQRDCSDVPGSGTAAVVRRYLVNIYYIANNSEDGDGIPTLKRAELSGKGELAWSVVPLVEGIDNLQVEYGAAGVFSAAPASVAGWRQVTAVKLHLLARNLEPTRDYSDERSYTLGDVTVEAPGDEFKRHVFQSQVMLRNPAGRME